MLNADLDVLSVHGLWKYCSVGSQRWHRRTGRPYVVHPHGMLEPWALRNAMWKKRVAALLYENQHLHGAACLRALSEAEAESIRSYGLRNPICVIPNGVDLPDLRESNAKTRIAASLRGNTRSYQAGFSAAASADCDWLRSVDLYGCVRGPGCHSWRRGQSLVHERLR